MIYELSLANMKSLDMGKADVAFQSMLQRVVADCNDRPGDDRPRKVILEVSCTPVMEVNGTCDYVETQIQVTSKVPTHRTSPYKMGIRQNGNKLVFSEDDNDYSRPGLYEEQA